MNKEDENVIDKQIKGENKRSFSNLLALGKDTVTFLRDLALFVLAFLLIALPTTFNTILSNAGFEEGSFVGFKWKPKLLKADAALIQAQATIAELKEQNDKMSKALGEAQTKLTDPVLKEQIAKLEEKNKQLIVTSSKVEDSVASTIESNAPLIEQVQNTSDTKAKWGIVFSGDPTLDAAKYEVEVIAPKLKIPNSSIYYRQGSYRSVSVVASRTEAQQVLPNAKQRRSDAYIVNMTNWCSNSNDKGAYKECVSP